MLNRRVNEPVDLRMRTISKVVRDGLSDSLTEIPEKQSLAQAYRSRSRNGWRAHDFDTALQHAMATPSLLSYGESICTTGQFPPFNDTYMSYTTHSQRGGSMQFLPRSRWV